MTLVNEAFCRAEMCSKCVHENLNENSSESILIWDHGEIYVPKVIELVFFPIKVFCQPKLICLNVFVIAFVNASGVDG